MRTAMAERTSVDEASITQKSKGRMRKITIHRAAARISDQAASLKSEDEEKP
jgi:hypothetical protein